ncbi:MULTISPECIES: MmcQ/YjbR family DNA-binding protein [Bacillus]|uniref:MmcQ/YjbR family DNA-binding protein n=1 Tax=Bacillus TaxID=1386 RepID=UPI001D0E2A36|nr:MULTISPECIES: MmcQ/YjbR family DNA-binding protein [Bacillus]MCC2528485.1 MmcQ/YjbR family DNA-binding protein [Bacillus halotolerans]MCK8101440.1 MmcQ/YjbR family DNA-binding protein [Bacillus sp. 2CMS4F]
MTLNEIIDYCLSYPDTYKDYPFGEGWTVMRHKGNKKLFALIFHLDGHLCINLKCEPERANFLRSIYKEVKPGYHMNKDHWNTIILDGALSKETLGDMVQHSFELTKPKKSHS